MADKFVYGYGWGLKDKNFSNSYGDSYVYKFTQAKGKPKILPNGDLNGSAKKSNGVQYSDNLVRFLTEKDALDYINSHPNFSDYIPFKARSRRVMRLVDSGLKVYETVPSDDVDFQLFDDNGKMMTSERDFTELKDIVDYLKKKTSKSIILPENIDVLSGIPYYTDTSISINMNTKTNGKEIDLKISPKINTSINMLRLDYFEQKIIEQEIASTCSLIDDIIYTNFDRLTYYIKPRNDIKLLISIDELRDQEDSFITYIERKAINSVEDFYAEHKDKLRKEAARSIQLIADEDKVIESFNNKLVEENEIDKFKDQLLDIYDINALILKLTKDKYQSFIWTDMALIQYGNGKGCIVDYEAVGKSFNSLDEKLKFDVSEKEEEVEQPDGSKVKSVSMYPYGTIKLSAKDIMQNAESHQEKAGDFFSKCYGSNWRCRENLEDVIDDLKASGYFDSDAIIESFEDKEEIIDEIARYFNMPDDDENGTYTEWNKEALMHDVNNGRGDEWVSPFENEHLPRTLFSKYLKLIDYFDILAGHVYGDPEEYISYDKCSELDELTSLPQYKVGTAEDILARELERICFEDDNVAYPLSEYFTEALEKTLQELRVSLAPFLTDRYVEGVEDESKGIQIAKILQDAMKDECGPFGGERPRRNGRVLEMHSQSPSTFYTFHDDGSVDVVGQDFDVQGDGSEEFNFHYDTIDEFLLSGDDGWFYTFGAEHPEAIDKIHDILDPETILESNNKRNVASIILYDGTKELESIDFEHDDEIEGVASRVVSAIKEYPQTTDLELVYVDDLINRTNAVSIDNFKSLSIDELEQEIFDILQDEWYQYWADITDYEDIEYTIEKLYKYESSSSDRDYADIDYDDIETECACIALVVCQFLNKPVDSIKSISFNEDGDYIRVLFDDLTSRYFYSRGIYTMGIKSADTGNILRWPDDFDPKKVELRGNDQDTFLESIPDNPFMTKERVEKQFKKFSKLYNDEEKAIEFTAKYFLTLLDLADARYDKILKRRIEQVKKYLGLYKDEKDTYIEEYDRITKEDEEWLDKKIEEHNFKVVSKRDHPYFKEVHYQIISNEGNKTKEDLDKEADWIDNLLDEFQGRSGSPCTYNMGLQDDGYISCGFDCRETSDQFRDKIIESDEFNNDDLVSEDESEIEVHWVQYDRRPFNRKDHYNIEKIKTATPQEGLAKVFAILDSYYEDIDELIDYLEDDPAEMDYHKLADDLAARFDGDGDHHVCYIKVNDEVLLDDRDMYDDDYYEEEED